MISKVVRGTMIAVLLQFVWGAAEAQAQFPNWRAVPVRMNIDLIPPLGNLLPRSYAARYNRPSYITGRIAYTIEPSSQEAMSWQRAWQRGDYANHAPRVEQRYMFAKPWEVLEVGAKPAPTDDPDGAAGWPEVRSEHGPSVLPDPQRGEQGAVEMVLPIEEIPSARGD